MVQIKHKVTIKTKTAQEETPVSVESPAVTLKRKQPEVANEPTKVAPVSEPKKKSNTGKIVGGIAAAAAILAGVYFFGIKGNDKSGNDANSPTEQIAQTGDVAQPEATPETDVPEESTIEEEGTVSDAPEAASPAETNEAPATTGNEQAPTPARSEDKKSDNPSPSVNTATTPVQQVQSPKNNATTTSIATSSAPLGTDVEENALRVIRGEFGAGEERKEKLGSAYSEIQNKVNEMYRLGQVY